MTPIIVLETSGKNDSVDYVKVKLFPSIPEAQKYCYNTTSDADAKYWTYAQIVDDDHKYELGRLEL